MTDLKRKQGRPRKEDPVVTEPVTVAGTAVATAATDKNTVAPSATVLSKDTKSDELEGEPAKKRGRGRPPKIEGGLVNARKAAAAAAQALSNEPKRGRGRPRKPTPEGSQVSASSTSAAPATEATADEAKRGRGRPPKN